MKNFSDIKKLLLGRYIILVTIFIDRCSLSHFYAILFQRQIKEGLSRMVSPSCLGASVSVGAILYCASRATNKEDSLSRSVTD